MGHFPRSWCCEVYEFILRLALSSAMYINPEPCSTMKDLILALCMSGIRHVCGRARLSWRFSIWVVLQIRVLVRVLFIRVSYYFCGPRKGPNLENYPFSEAGLLSGFRGSGACIAVAACCIRLLEDSGLPWLVAVHSHLQ